MSTRADVTFEVKSWDEQPYDEMDDGPRLTRARVTKAFSGDIEGDSTLEYLMMHRADGSASFVGLERVVGTLCGRSGSFVIRHQGTFEEGMAATDWSVVPDSGTGELRGLRGEGSFALQHAERYAVNLEFEFA